MADPQELIENIQQMIADSDVPEVLQQDIHDALVMTVNIDDTLSISGEAADALAVGNALATKASIYDVKNTLSVNGQTGGGTWDITVNGDEIPAQSDSDTETVADALTRLGSGLSDEITARENADTSLDGRLDTIEAWDASDIPVDKSAATPVSIESALQSLDGRVENLEEHEGFSTVISFNSTGTQTVSDSIITANHDLTGVQFYDSNSDATNDILADFTWATAAGSLTVTISNVHANGSVRLNFGWREGVS